MEEETQMRQNYIKSLCQDESNSVICVARPPLNNKPRRDRGAAGGSWEGPRRGILSTHRAPPEALPEAVGAAGTAPFLRPRRHRAPRGWAQTARVRQLQISAHAQPLRK